jgi:Fe2+ transport system protein FeoA
MNRNLYEAGKKGTFQVISAPEIGLLENLGLRTGTIIKIQNRYMLGGPVLLRVEDAYSVALGKDIAKQIQVQEIAS